MNESLPVAVLLGLYLGALTGVVPALVSWSLGFLFRYVTGVTLPGFGVVVLGVGIAGIQGGLLGLLEEGVSNSPTAIVAVVVVMMLTLYAHAHGDRVGAEFPRRLTLRTLQARTLSADVVERVGGFGQVRVRVTGEVGDIEGYPPLSADLRAAVRDIEWTFPADLTLAALESRVEDRLKTEFDLSEAVVSLDARARATVSAAPPAGALSRRVPAGERAVAVDTLVPTGLAREDEVSIVTGEESVTGTVVSVPADSTPQTPASALTPESAGETADAPETAADEERAGPPTATGQPRTASGGAGRVAVAVSSSAVPTVVGAETPKLVVRSRGTRREFELLSLLRRAGKRVRSVTVGPDGDLDGAALGEAGVRETHDVAVLAVRNADGWTLAPRGTTVLRAGDELFAVGSREALARFAEVAA